MGSLWKLINIENITCICFFSIGIETVYTMNVKERHISCYLIKIWQILLIIPLKSKTFKSLPKWYIIYTIAIIFLQVTLCIYMIYCETILLDFVHITRSKFFDLITLSVLICTNLYSIVSCVCVERNNYFDVAKIFESLDMIIHENYVRVESRKRYILEIVGMIIFFSSYVYFGMCVFNWTAEQRIYQIIFYTQLFYLSIFVLFLYINVKRIKEKIICMNRRWSNLCLSKLTKIEVNNLRKYYSRIYEIVNLLNKMYGYHVILISSLIVLYSIKNINEAITSKQLHQYIYAYFLKIWDVSFFAVSNLIYPLHYFFTNFTKV